MVQLESRYNVIFFHMGPGFHARIEAHAFSQQFPYVAFWDQPWGLSFTALRDWACEQIRQQAALSGRPLILVGHSFGGQVIAATLPFIGHLVSEVRFLNTAFDGFHCFVNLQKVLFPAEAKELSHWQNQSAESKTQLVFQVSQHPHFNESYWCQLEKQKDYEQIAAQYPALDIPSFLKIFSESLQGSLMPQDLSWSGNCEIYYSSQDKLIQNFSTVQPWQRLFPQAQMIDIPQVGHHALFESPELAKRFFRSSKN